MMVPNRGACRRVKRENQAVMKTKKCPLCQGEQFFTSTMVPYNDGILLAPFKRVGVYGSVCLSCGFVAPTLNDVGLATIREMASRQEKEIHEKPSEQEFGEL
jgi:hypothetical protein